MPELKHVLSRVLDAVRSRSNDTASEVEIYRQLDSQRKEIRVLEVLPGSGDEPLVCSLQRVSLLAKRKPDYETISYVWGDQDVRGTIRIRGQVLDIPISSEIALRRMRMPDRKRSLWIDAVCINQEDPRERGQQVAFMHEIYANGQKNLIWLGESDDCTEQALAGIRELVEAMKTETNNFKDVKDMLYTADGKRKYSSIPLSLGIDDLSALKRFFQNSWFSRLWVVQEAAASQSNVCHCGEYLFPLEDVMRAAIWMDYKFYTLGITRSSWYRKVNKLASLADHTCGTFALFPRDRRSPLAFIDSLQLFRVSDPRDHVFGTLGLMQLYGCDPAISAAVPPDYSAGTIDVFRDTTKFIIERAGGTNVLQRVSNRFEDDHADQPSWIPLWDRQSRRHDASLFTHRDFAAANHVLQPLPLPKVQDMNTLALTGITIDYVEDYSVRLRDEEIPTHRQLMALFKSARTLVQHVPENGDKDLFAVLADTLMLTTRHRNDCTDTMQCSELYGACMANVVTGSTENLGEPVSPEPVSTLTQQAKECHLAAHKTLANRRLFSTSLGTLGVGPSAMQPRDIVAILYGSDVAYILRPCQKYSEEATHQLIGACCVRGIMKGEAVKAHRTAGLEDEIFYLR